jgi:hypothetical protein
MEASEAEKLKARRVQLLLVVLMVVLISAPFLIFLLRSR